jgi:hypothetical protein
MQNLPLTVEDFLLSMNAIWVILTESCLTLTKNTIYTTVKPAHAGTSIKQSPVLKGHLFLVLS